MNRLYKDQRGMAAALAVLLVVVIAITGAVALKTSEAYRLKKRSARPGGSTSIQNSGSQASCSANGSSTQVSGSGSAYASCNSASTPGTPGVNNTTIHSSQGANGAGGTASCTVNGQPIAC